MVLAARPSSDEASSPRPGPQPRTPPLYNSFSAELQVIGRPICRSGSFPCSSSWGSRMDHAAGGNHSGRS